MARFKNSNRSAAAQMAYTATRARSQSSSPETTKTYFQRIGFDVAMI